MMETPIMMTHADHGRLSDLLARMPQQDRQHFKELRRELTRARCVAPNDIPSDVVTMGSTVHLRELESDDPWTFTVCFPEEADIRQNRISILSPVGTAIIGCRIGDVVDWPVPGGSVRIRLESLSYQPETAGRTETVPCEAELPA